MATATDVAEPYLGPKHLHLVAAVAVAGVLFAGGLSLKALIGSVCIIIVALFLARKRAGDAHSQPKPSALDFHSGDQNNDLQQLSQGNLDGLCLDVIPVWVRQIELAKGQTEEAITELSQKFASISHDVNSAVSATHGNSDTSEGDLVRLLEQSQTKLHAMVTDLRSAAVAKQSLLQNISSLASFTVDLEKMAQSVGEIAKRSNLVALNAAIVAARAGEEGRSFSVVAREIGKLSSLSAETGKQMVETITHVNKGIQATLEQSNHFTAKDEEILSTSENLIEGVLTDFRVAGAELTESSGALQKQSLLVGQEIDQVLISLQFQDRVSQILMQVANDMGRLQEQVKERASAIENGYPPTDFDLQEWQNAMKKSYTMADQYLAHHGNQNSASASSDDITFF